MRYIDKGKEPDCLREWKAEAIRARAESGTGMITYRDGFNRTGDLRRDLAAEQGGLCGYTGEYLHGGGHVEHIKPVEECQKETEAGERIWGEVPEEDLDHRNLIAAVTVPLRKVTKRNPGETKAYHEARRRATSYGAVAKQSDYHPQMVKPTEVHCETRLLYLETGEVRAVDSNDAGAEWTIDTLNLKHPTLARAREGAIVDALYEDPENAVLRTPQELRDVIASMGQQDTCGRLPEYAFVILQTARAVL